MTTNVSEQTLLEGSWWALAQAGRLLGSAASLFDNGDSSTALAVAMFGREELGRSRLLRQCAKEVRDGKALQAIHVIKRCDNHVSKQAAAALSTVLRPSRDSELGKALSAMSASEPGSEAWTKADDLIKAAGHAKRKRQPNERHNARCSSIYVDLNDEGTDWLCPVDTSRDEARNHIFDAVNDYSLEVDRLTNEGLRSTLEQSHPHLSVEAMNVARAKMLRTVEIPRAIWPKYP